MSARDELAEVIANFRDDWCKVKRMTPAGIDRDEADAILAAGYTKPRKVYTTAELDDLPESSVVLDESGVVALQIGRGLWSMGGDEYTSDELTADWLLMPAIVLYEPAP